MTPAEAIECLRERGLTETAIAALAGTSQSSVNRIRRGVMAPGYDLGKKLVDLAEDASVTAQPPANDPHPHGVDDAA